MTTDERQAATGPQPLSRRQVRLLLAAGASFILSALVSVLAQWWSGHIDLQVYRNGARVWLDGGDLYGPMPPVAGIGLPFTYPPLAALFFVPLALMPLPLAEVLVLLTSLACLAATLWLVLDLLYPEMARPDRVALVIGAVALLQMFEPVRQTVGFGQINLVLMAAITLDCLVRKPFWPRGTLIGIAAAVKLIPVAYLLYFLLRKDWKACGTLIAAALGAGAVGFLLFPRDSTDYWFGTLRDTGRIGPPYYAGNQSLKGFAFRLGVPDPAATLIWITLSLIAIGLAALWMKRLVDASRVVDPPTVTGVTTKSIGHAAFGNSAEVAALLVNAAAVLLVSPVSWSHHWVWVAPALMLTAAVFTRLRATSRPGSAEGSLGTLRDRLLMGVFAAIILMFLIGPHWLLPHQADRELGWAWWQQLIGSSYVLVTFAIFAAAVVLSDDTTAGRMARSS